MNQFGLRNIPERIDLVYADNIRPVLNTPEVLPRFKQILYHTNRINRRTFELTVMNIIYHKYKLRDYNHVHLSSITKFDFLRDWKQIMKYMSTFQNGLELFNVFLYNIYTIYLIHFVPNNKIVFQDPQIVKFKEIQLNDLIQLTAYIKNSCINNIEVLREFVDYLIYMANKHYYVDDNFLDKIALQNFINMTIEDTLLTSLAIRIMKGKDLSKEVLDQRESDYTINTRVINTTIIKYKFIIRQFDIARQLILYAIHAYRPEILYVLFQYIPDDEEILLINKLNEGYSRTDINIPRLIEKSKEHDHLGEEYYIMLAQILYEILIINHGEEHAEEIFHDRIGQYIPDQFS